MPKEKDKNRKLLIAAAFLSSEGMLQKEIAKRLQVSQPEVSRLLQQAVELGLLKVHPSLNKDKLLPGELEMLDHDLHSEPQLLALMRGKVSKGVKFDLHIVDAREDEFSIAARARVLELIEKSKSIGVLWGRTILKLVEAIEAQSLPHNFNPAVQCIPLCGDPLFIMDQENQGFSASHLAARLEKCLTGCQRFLPSLRGVPAYLGQLPVHREKDRHLIVEYIRTIPGYRKIFVPPNAFIDRVDTVLTGIGIFGAEHENEQDTGAFLRERVAQEQITLEQLQSLVLGELGGILISRTNLSEPERRKVANLNSGWLGASEEQILRISKNNQGNNSAGVVTLANGKRKAEIVKAALTLGYINELIIDRDLADELRKIL